MHTINAELESGGTLLSQGAPTHPRSWLAQPWLALTVRVLGIALLMAGLAAIGALSVLGGAPTGELLDADASTRADVAAAWLAVSRDTQSTHPTASLGTSKLTTTTASAIASSAPPPSGGITEDGKVVLNQASAEELTRLPGVGVKRAAAIVALRDRIGRFKRSSDLLRVRGIGPKSLQKMKPHFVLDSPDPKEKGRERRREHRDTAAQ